MSRLVKAIEGYSRRAEVIAAIGEPPGDDDFEACLDWAWRFMAWMQDTNPRTASICAVASAEMQAALDKRERERGE